MPVSSSPVVPGMRRKREDDESQASSATGATGATGIDSMLPVVQPRKRRRTTFLRAFQSFNLQRESDDDGEDADSSQAVANENDDDGGSSTTTTTSSLEDVEGVEDEEDQLLLSDKEIAQRKASRKVMLELVFGSDPKTSAVDLKLQAMLRTSIRQTTTERESVDDMNIETSYSRPSALMQATLHRSNSLPDFLVQDQQSEQKMDTDSSG